MELVIETVFLLKWLSVFFIYKVSEECNRKKPAVFDADKSNHMGLIVILSQLKFVIYNSRY